MEDKKLLFQNLNLMTFKFLSCKPSGLIIYHLKLPLGYTSPVKMDIYLFRCYFTDIPTCRADDKLYINPKYQSKLT